MFANAQEGGLDLGFPDVIISPVGVPVPGPNVAEGPLKVPAVYNILTGGTPAHNLATMSPITEGDPVGAGAASGTVIGPSRHLTGAFTVLVGGMPATRMTSMSLQNVTNCPGVAIAPAQTTLLVLAP
ncbi:MAG TPA: DUF4150 domain-containing protein [Polyangiaceae bacterium]